MTRHSSPLPWIRRRWSDACPHGPECLTCWSINNFGGRPIDHVFTRWPNLDEPSPRFDFWGNRPVVPRYLPDRLHTQILENHVARVGAGHQKHFWKWRTFWLKVLLARLVRPIINHLSDGNRYRGWGYAVLAHVLKGIRRVRWVVGKIKESLCINSVLNNHIAALICCALVNFC